MAERIQIELVVVDKTSRALSKTRKSVINVNNSLMTTSQLAKNAAGALALIGGVNVIKSIVATTARFEDLRTSLSAVTGSAQGGKKAFDDIIKFSTKTQFGVEDLSKTFIKLKASGIEPTEELLTTFTDTAAITTDQIGTLEAITDLFARTVSGGLGLEELNRLADRGVPVFRILEEQLGITRLEVSNFGKTAEGAKKITDALSTGIRQQYGGATAKVVGNLSTQFSNFSIALKNAADQFGQALAPELKKATQDLTNFIEGNADKLPEIARDVAAFGKDAAEALALIGGGIRKLYNLADELGLGEIGILGFLLLGTKGKVAVLAIGSFVELIDRLKKSLDESAESAQDLSDSLVSPDDELNNWITSTNKASESMGIVVTQMYDFDDSIEGASNALSTQQQILDRVNSTIGESNVIYYEFTTLQEEAAERARTLAAENAALKKEMEKTFAGQVIRGISNYKTQLDELIAKKYTIANIINDTLFSAITTWANTAERELADVVMGAKTLQEALGNIAQSVLRELIQGFIRLVIIRPILDKLAEKLGVNLDAALNREKAINRELQKQIAFRLVLMAITGGSGGFIPGLASGGPVTRGQPYVVGEEGPEVFLPKESGTIIPNDKLGGMSSGADMMPMGEQVTVNFNINTVDASGFDELLVDRRNTIVGIINQALAKRGKQGVTA
jgi:flagellar hook-basal body complex protein FliE